MLRARGIGTSFGKAAARLRALLRHGPKGTGLGAHMGAPLLFYIFDNILHPAVENTAKFVNAFR